MNICDIMLTFKRLAHLETVLSNASLQLDECPVRKHVLYSNFSGIWSLVVRIVPNSLSWRRMILWWGWIESSSFVPKSPNPPLRTCSYAPQHLRLLTSILNLIDCLWKILPTLGVVQHLNFLLHVMTLLGTLWWISMGSLCFRGQTAPSWFLNVVVRLYRICWAFHYKCKVFLFSCVIFVLCPTNVPVGNMIALDADILFHSVYWLFQYWILNNFVKWASNLLPMSTVFNRCNIIFSMISFTSARMSLCLW